MIIIPSVSIGNVPQLAVDLIIHTYGFELIASLDDEFLAPFVGPMDHTVDTPNLKGIATAAQIFRLGDNYLVQLRSPPLTGQKHRFLQSLSQQLERDGLLKSDIFIAGSSNAGMSEVRNAGTITQYSATEAASHTFPESGFVKEALGVFPRSSLLVSWVHEGDNFADGEKLATKLIEILQLEPRSFTPPVSWRRVYGREIPAGLERGLYT